MLLLLPLTVTVAQCSRRDAERMYAIKDAGDWFALDGKYYGFMSKDPKNWALGSWNTKAACTKSYPCSSCSPHESIVFREDMTYRHWKVPGGSRGPPDKCGTDKNRPPNTLLAKGTYIIIDRVTVELTQGE